MTSAHVKRQSFGSSVGHERVLNRCAAPDAIASTFVKCWIDHDIYPRAWRRDRPSCGVRLRSGLGRKTPALRVYTAFTVGVSRDGRRQAPSSLARSRARWRSSEQPQERRAIGCRGYTKDCCLATPTLLQARTRTGWKVRDPALTHFCSS